MCALGGGEDPSAADQAAPAKDSGLRRESEIDQPRLPGILIHLGVLATNNPFGPLGQAAVARAVS